MTGLYASEAERRQAESTLAENTGRAPLTQVGTKDLATGMVIVFADQWDTVTAVAPDRTPGSVLTRVSVDRTMRMTDGTRRTKPAWFLTGNEATHLVLSETLPA